jgi:MFS family permease
MMIPSKESIWNPLFISVFIANALLNVSQQMVQPLLTAYAKAIGAADVILGVVASIFTVTALALKLVAAPAIDTFNKKYILAISTTVSAVSFFGFSISRSIEMIIVFRLLQGCALAFTATCCLSLATDALPRAKISQGISIFTLGKVLSQAIAPSIGTYIAGFFSYNVTFAVAGVFMLCASAIALRTKSDMDKREKPKFRLSLQSVIAMEAIMPAIILFLMSLSYFLVYSYLIVFANDQGVTDSSIGLYFTIYAITLLFTRPFVGKQADRIGVVKVIIPAMMIFAISFILLSYSNTLWMFLLAAVVFAFGYGAIEPSLSALGLKTVSPDRRGAASCTVYIGIDFGNLIGPIAAGAIAGAYGYVIMWRMALIPIAVAIVITIACRKQFAN